MRIALLIGASLLAAACDQTPREGTATGEAAAPATGADSTMLGTDADGAFAEGTPTGTAFVQRQAVSDMYEITSSNLALEKAESEPAKEFARMMVADHTRSSEALKAAVEQSGQTLSVPTELDAEHEAQLDILRSLNGADFEREYMSQQMAAHRKALALLKAYGGEGDTAELRQFAQATIPVVQRHHDWLETNAPVPGATSSPTARATTGQQ